MAFTPRQEVT